MLEPPIAVHTSRIKRVAPLITPIEISRLLASNSTVTEVPIEDWMEISRIAEAWGEMSRTKLAAIEKNSYRQLGFKTIFENSMYICDSISYLIKTPVDEHPEGSEAWDTILICRDTEETIHAIALFNRSVNKLAYIVTHPNNIHHDINQIQVHGAATQIILHLAKKTHSTNSVLRLKSVESAKPFYSEKLKFESDFENQDEMDTTWHIRAMKLTATKIQDLMKRRVAPYDQLV